MCSLNVAFRLRHESVRTGRILGLECFTGTGFGLTRALTLGLSIINQTLVPIDALSLQRPSSSALGWEAKDGRNQKYRKGSQRTGEFLGVSNALVTIRILQNGSSAVFEVVNGTRFRWNVFKSIEATVTSACSQLEHLHTAREEWTIGFRKA